MKKLLLSVAVAACGFGAFAADDVVYFESNFAKTWEVFKDWEGSGNNEGKSIDCYGSDNVNNYLPNMFTTVKDANEKSAGQYLADEGWIIFGGGQDPNPAANNGANFQKFYLKLGSGDKENGVTLPKIEAFGDGVENVTLSFNWFPMRKGSKAGSGVYDEINIVVIVTNGDNEVQFPVPELRPAEGSRYEWHPESIALTGVTINKDTRISVRPCDAQYLPNGLVKGNYRFCIDAFKVTGKSAGVAELTVDENAPVEYYNLQGVKVTNPENGVYIRRQGSNVTKVTVK